MYTFSLYSNLSYFLKYELSLKFLYSNLYAIPSIRSIILTSPLNTYFKNKVGFGVDLKNSSIFQLIFFIFYYYFSVVPYIRISFNKDELEKNYFLKIIFNTNYSIFTFLLSIMLNNSLGALNLLRGLKSACPSINYCSVSIFTSGLLFKNFTEFLQIGLLKILLKDLKFNINILFFKIRSNFSLILFHTITNSWLV
jgi:hypothetical protein